MIELLVILLILVGGLLAIYWVTKPSPERGVENSADEVRVVEHPPGYYMPQWKPAGYDWWIDLDDEKHRSLNAAQVRARRHRDYCKAAEEPERIHEVPGGAEL